ncbi:MAG: class I SAM-dependent methyltransferase, partial [Actinomycetota bacterium]
GWGFWVEMARAFAVDVYGLEPASSRSTRASEQGLQVIDVERMKDLRFDFINTEQVFEHLPEPYETAVELSQVLAPGGILKISVPNSMRVKRHLRRGDWLKAGNPLNDVFPLQHINAFTNRSIMKLAERTGLEPVPIPARLRYRYMPTWERPSRLLKRTVGAHYRTIRNQTTVVWLRRPGGASNGTATETSDRNERPQANAKPSRRRG